MSDSPDEKPPENLPEISIDLESPPEPESPMAGMGSGSIGALFGSDDSIGMTTAKLSVAEALLKSLTKDEKFGDFMRDLLLSIMKVIKCEAGSVFEVDGERNALFFRAVVGQSSDRLASIVIPMGQGIVGHVAESRQPVVVSNVSENKMHLKAVQEAVGFETRNIVAVPIIVRGRTFGVLELLNRVGEGEFTPSDVELLTACVQMCSKAIEIRLMIAWASQKRVAA